MHREPLTNSCPVPCHKEDYDTYQEAFRRERQIKKWTRAKKEALIAGDIERLKELSKSKDTS